MERFVLLRLYDFSRGEDVDRWFNLSVIRQFDVERNEVILQGSHNPIKVSTESIGRLLRMVGEANELVRLGTLRLLPGDNGMRTAIIRERTTLWSKIKGLLLR